MNARESTSGTVSGLVRGDPSRLASPNFVKSPAKLEMHMTSNLDLMLRYALDNDI